MAGSQDVPAVVLERKQMGVKKTQATETEKRGHLTDFVKTKSWSQIRVRLLIVANLWY